MIPGYNSVEDAVKALMEKMDTFNELSAQIQAFSRARDKVLSEASSLRNKITSESDNPATTFPLVVAGDNSNEVIILNYQGYPARRPILRS